MDVDEQEASNVEGLIGSRIGAAVLLEKSLVQTTKNYVWKNV
jgi:hypothetical protein